MRACALFPFSNSLFLHLFRALPFSLQLTASRRFCAGGSPERATWSVGRPIVLFQKRVSEKEREEEQEAQSIGGGGETEERMLNASLLLLQSSVCATERVLSLLRVKSPSRRNSPLKREKEERKRTEARSSLPSEKKKEEKL